MDRRNLRRFARKLSWLVGAGLLSATAYAAAPLAGELDATLSEVLRNPEVTRVIPAQSGALRNIIPQPPLFERPAEKEIRRLPLPVLHLTPEQQAQHAAQAASVLQSGVSGPAIATSDGINFAGLGQGDYGFNVQAAPPDTTGAAGATQFVQWVNTSYVVFDKATGTKLMGPIAGNQIFTSLGGRCASTNNGDPVVLYDKAANRWVLSQFVASSPYLQCVAVSNTSDATGTFSLYAFSLPKFGDYPKLGVWPDAYYASFNIFGGGIFGIGQTFQGARACAYDRAKMLAGQPATQVCFQLSKSYGGLLPSDLDGATPPPAGSPNYFVNFGTNALRLWKFHVNFAAPSSSTFTGPASIAVAAFTPACSGGTCIPQPGTSQQLDSLADRLMFRLAYRNLAGTETLVVNHSVQVGSNTTSSAVRWYELHIAGGTASVFQQGSFAPDASDRWMGSAAMDKVGDIAVGYSLSSTSIYPSVSYSGRVPTDPAGILQPEKYIVQGTGGQNGNLNRWGDYSTITIDPVDDCTFWCTQEYEQVTGSFNWKTRIASFKFANCQ